MKDERDKNSIDGIVDDAIASIKAHRPTEAEINAASERVHKLLKSKQMKTEEITTPAGKLDSIDHYIAAIPDYLDNQLTPAQTILFEEESRQSIPLRRALNTARDARNVPSNENQERARHGTLGFRWLAAAACVAVIAISVMLVMPELPSFDQSRLAQVEAIDGDLYQVAGGRLTVLAPGYWIDGGIDVRTGKDSTAILRLDDGSRIEIASRSELSVTRRPSGNRIDIERGRIMVAASKQGSGTLDVTTDEFIVSVTGTIFEVGHGAKGSRVAVIEGEVQVYQQGDSTSLLPGEQMGSRTGLLNLNIEHEIAWSQDADQYIEMLREVSALQRDIGAAMKTPPRYSTRLLDLASADTVVYIAVPNAPEKITEVYELLRSRMQENNGLALLWDNIETKDGDQHLEEIMSWLSDVGDDLGDETVVTLSLQEGGEGRQIVPVVLSEVDADSFRSTFDARLEQIRALGDEGDGADTKELNISLIEDPADAVSGHLSIWLHEDLMVATLSPEAMQDMQSVLESGTSEFADSGFHSLLISAYDQGAEFLGAVHTARILSETDLTRPELNTLGLQNAQYLIAQRHQQGDLATLSAEVHFDGERTGIMSWLTSPAPMASLEFFSANATIAAAFVVKDPSVIIDEMEQMASKLAEHAEEPRQTSHPMDLELRNAMISSLGGEVALGLDGPTLPVPSWKLVVEVYDELRLQDSIERAIDQINQEAAERDEGFSVQINAADVGSYTGYQISVSVKPGSTAASVQGMLTASYVYMDGYLVAAPSVALVDKAINTYQSGTGLLTDIEFQALVPQDGELNFSAVSFSRVGDLIEDLIEHLPSSLSQEQQEQVKQLNEGTGPSMYSVYAKADSIRIVQKGDTDLPFSLSQLFSLQSMVSGATGQTSLTDIIGDTTQDMLEDNQ